MAKILGVCSWSLGPVDTTELAGLVGACGLSRVQLALDPLRDGRWDQQKAINTLAAADIGICSGMMACAGEDYSTLDSIKATGGLRPDEHWKTNQTRAIANAVVARRFGIKLVTFHAGFIPENDAKQRRTMVERIGAIARIFTDQGVLVGLETGQERAETLLELLGEPGLETVGVNFDPANMVLYGMGDPAKAIELLRDRIVQVHMKDALPTETHGTWGREVPAGEGGVDWAHFFAVVRTMGDDVGVVIEREGGENRVAEIIQARELANKHGYPS